MNTKKQIEKTWEKMSLTKCWKYANTFYKKEHLKDMIHYWLIEGAYSTDDNEEELKEILNKLKWFIR